MNRSTLDFLKPMFPVHFSDYSILVINQTTQGNLLQSGYPGVRVINSFEKGLSKSRNLALQNAENKLILLTDDDVEFTPDFDENIVKAFNNGCEDFAAIQFCAEDKERKRLKSYPSKNKALSYLNILSAMSIELVYNKEKILGSKLRFDENFGLGAAFPLGEEHIFLGDLKRAGYKLGFYKEYIVRHSNDKNSDKIPFKQWYETLGSYYKRMFPGSYLLWIFIYFGFNIKQGKLSFFKVPFAFSYFIKGKNSYLQTK
ncbi:glycosyltransferase [Flavobacterium rakeshii]|uniref:glycosyltransferase family 2 protein n=1 Tax=Flavobacterium rakeshii TaxID=1038845 RepID=UPI002E7B7E84|nr:glycosyltransferase [Flavobacterium rakeshii]MEE1898992.1 glycosyltransferase [Flavobacterium rakeshii]